MIKIIENNIRSLINLIKYPFRSAKSLELAKKNKIYTFYVHKKVNKTEIRLILKEFFNAKVEKIWTLTLPKKKRRVGKFRGLKSQYKKTIIKIF